MKLETVHKLERAIIVALNLDGWDLTWTGEKFEHYDAVGRTPKGKDCIIEFKFRKTYYETKILEKYKYDELMNMPYDLVKLYSVHDPKGNYLYWLNELDVGEPVTMYLPDTTMWDTKKIKKQVYLLTEQQAAIFDKSS